MTIAEIAQRAGVSKACVSRYLNHGYVSEEKKVRIRAVIEETGYTPSRNAQVLRTGKTGVIGVILPKINSESIGRIAAGISEVLTREGYRLLLANTENQVDQELAYLELFKRDQVDGVIFIATILTPNHRELITEMNVPVVIIGQRADYLSCVYHNDRAAARELTRLLLASGASCPGLLGVTRKDRAVGSERRAGFLEACTELGLTVPDQHMETCGFTIESGYDAAKTLFERSPEIDALFCATDTIAIGAMQYLKGTGRNIPEEIEISGIGHSRMTEIISPRLTTAHFFYKTSGAEAATILCQILMNGVDMKKQIMLGYELISQESTRSQPSKDSRQHNASG